MVYAALGCLMLGWALAVLGLAGDNGRAVRMAWIPFTVGLVLLVIPLIFGPIPPSP